MLEELYAFYLPKKTHPWCYISLEIDPQNVDVNVHPTKHEVKFLHETFIIERMKFTLDEKLSGNSASRTFYVQARLPKADVTKEVLKEVLPEYEKESDKTKKLRPQEMIRTDSSDQKLDRFNFTIHSAMKYSRYREDVVDECVDSMIDKSKSNENTLSGVENEVNRDTDQIIETDKEENEIQCLTPDINASNARGSNELSRIKVTNVEQLNTPWSNIIDDSSPSTPSEIITINDKVITSENCTSNIQDISETAINELNETENDSMIEECIDIIADKARKQVYQCFKSAIRETGREEPPAEKSSQEETKKDKIDESDKSNEAEVTNIQAPTDSNKNDIESEQQFKSYSINNFRREVKLTSVLKLRKEVETECHEGLREILANLTFVGCINQFSALVQSGVNLYFCNTKQLA